MCTSYFQTISDHIQRQNTPNLKSFKVAVEALGMSLWQSDRTHVLSSGVERLQGLASGASIHDQQVCCHLAGIANQQQNETVELQDRWRAIVFCLIMQHGLSETWYFSGVSEIEIAGELLKNPASSHSEMGFQVQELLKKANKIAG